LTPTAQPSRNSCPLANATSLLLLLLSLLLLLLSLLLLLLLLLLQSGAEPAEKMICELVAQGNCR
jgi:hypothetical protein